MFVNTAQRIFKNTGVQVVGSLLNSFIGLFITGMLARYLGKSGYGEYSLVFVYLFFSTSLAYLGFDTILLRELSKDNDKKNQDRLLSAGVILKMAFSLLAISLTLIYLSFVEYSAHFKLAIIIANLTLIVGTVESLETIFKARLKMVYSAISSVVSQSLHFLFLLLAISIQANLPYLIAAYLFARICRVVCIYYFSKKITVIKFEFDWQSILFILKNSVLLGIANGLWIIYNKIDNVMLEFMKGVDFVGQYNAAYKFVDMTSLFAGMVMNSIFPLMSKRFSDDFSGLKRIYQKAIDYASLFGSTLTLLLILMSPYLIPIIFGRNFYESITTLKILGLVAFFMFLNNVQGHMLIILDKRGKLLLLLGIIGVIVNVVFNLFLIPLLGSNGAALATVITEFSMIIMTLYLISQKMKFRPSMKIPVLGMLTILLAYSISYIIPINHINVIVGFFVYIIVIIKFFPIDWKEVKEIVAK